MADNEIKPLVTVVSFLALFVLLTGLIPGEFYAESYEGRQIKIPEYFEGIDIQSFAETYNFTIAYNGGSDHVEDFVLGGWNIYFRIRKNAKFAKTAHYAEWWGFHWDYHFADWVLSSTGVNYEDELSYDELNSTWDGTLGMIGFNAKTDQTQWRVYFGWNTTEYDDPIEALDDNAMSVLYAIGFDEVNTAVNAWALVGMILFFQMPNVHPGINAMVAIPLWIAISYLVYVLILKAIPFVGG